MKKVIVVLIGFLLCSGLFISVNNIYEKREEVLYKQRVSSKLTGRFVQEPCTFCNQTGKLPLKWYEESYIAELVRNDFSIHDTMWYMYNSDLECYIPKYHRKCLICEGKGFCAEYVE